MAGVNVAIVMGHLGRDPEITYTPSGMAVCKFSIATSKKKKNGEEVTQWHRLTAFDKAGELISKYVKKGDQLYVSGEINYGEYEKDGVKRYTTDIIVREFNFIGGGNGQGNQQNNGHQNQPQNSNQGQNQQGYQPQNQNTYNQSNQNQSGQQPPFNQSQDDTQIPF